MPTYSIADIGRAQGWWDPQNENYAQQWRNAPTWAQDIMRRGITEVHLTDDQMQRAAEGQAINPFRYGAPNPYGPEVVGYGPTDAIDAYMRDNPAYAERLRNDPAWANTYAAMSNQPHLKASQGGPGTTVNYWESRGITNPYTAPFVQSAAQSVARHNWNADQLRRAVMALTG